MVRLRLVATWLMVETRRCVVCLLSRLEVYPWDPSLAHLSCDLSCPGSCLDWSVCLSPLLVAGSFLNQGDHKSLECQ